MNIGTPRRIRPALAGESIEVGDITLDPVAHKVTRRGRTLQLGPTEYRLLKFFMESPGRVFSRGQLLDGVWGTESEIELRTVDVHIRRLRKAIEIDGLKHFYFSNRSAAYLGKGDFAAALKDAEKCVKLAPRWAKGFLR